MSPLTPSAAGSPGAFTNSALNETWRRDDLMNWNEGRRKKMLSLEWNDGRKLQFLLETISLLNGDVFFFGFGWRCGWIEDGEMSVMDMKEMWWIFAWWECVQIKDGGRKRETGGRDQWDDSFLATGVPSSRRRYFSSGFCTFQTSSLCFNLRHGSIESQRYDLSSFSSASS